MKIKLPWKNEKITLERDLKLIEKRLSSVLNPIEPRPEFLRSLRTKVVGEPRQGFFGLPAEKLHKGVLIAGGVLSFTVMVISGVRIIITLLGALGLIQLNKQMKGSSKIPPQPAV